MAKTRAVGEGTGRKSPRAKNRQDATLRNNAARTKEIAALLARIRSLTIRVAALEQRLNGVR
jgi:hypothetical protein